MFNVATAFVKFTLLFQFFRIFRYVPTMRTVYIIAMLVVGFWCISQIIVNIIPCLPIQANWDFNSVGTATCVATSVGTYGNAIGTMLSDIIVLFLPLPTIWSLRLNTMQKWAAFGVFGIGAM
jgi:hypothetical protein